uniref:3-hydroxyisobutyrate dehydrogenase n=2 Tax=Odontella aurita TaxID=265563 RepID=A0A7S4KC67_9STRA|mmetsp:Transcript_9261/g.27912  ORF Transcript_9261/g.27912 Transcript_9261/m.27912 type:complete len:435 (+) Transcript_9261:1-1305(+)
MYDVVRGAAGMSWMFGDRGARMIWGGGGDRPPPVMSAVDIFLKDLGIVRSEAKAARSPVPLAAAAFQQFVAARGLGLGREDDSRVVKAYEAVTGVTVGGKKGGGEYSAPASAQDGTSSGTVVEPQDVTVVGIGAMGGGIARALLRADATKTVCGYDRSDSLASSFLEEAKEAGKARGNEVPRRLDEAVTNETDSVILVLVNERQCEEVCFGGQADDNLLSLMKSGSCVILCSTVTATWAKRAAERFAARGIRFVDCPISGGPARAKTGELTMMASGDDDSMARAVPLLNAAGRDVHVIPGGAGFGSTVKMVHQLLAGVHVVCAAEALALSAKTGIDPRQMYGIVNGAAGASWMFADRGGRMIAAGEPDVMSAVDIFVKDLDIVLSEAAALGCPVPIASAALQQFISAQGMGLGRKDDSQVIRVYEQITGVSAGR